MAMLAFEDAAAILETARESLLKADRLDLRESFELRLRAGLAFLRGGQGDRGRALCAAAADEARRLGDGDSLARAALSYGAELMLAQTNRTLIDLLTEALEKLPAGASGIRAQVMARLASAEMSAFDPTGPMQMARDAVAMARAAGADDDVMRAVLTFAGSALADYGEPAERAAVSEELVTRARTARDKVQVLRAECRLVFDYMELGDVDKSLRAIDRYAAVAAEFRQSRHLWPVPLMRAMYATAQGRGADAARLLAEARAIAASDPEPIAQAVLAWHALAQVVHSNGSTRSTRSTRSTTAPSALQIGTHGHIAETMLRLGRIALLARFGGDTTEVNRLLDSLPWEVGFLHKEPTNIISIAEPIAIARNTTLAALLHPAAVAAGERVGFWGRTGFVCTGPAERARALFAGTLGRHDEAIDCLERAATRNQQLGFRLFLGDVRCWQAHYLRRAGAAVTKRAPAPAWPRRKRPRAPTTCRDSCCASPRCAPPGRGRARGCAWRYQPRRRRRPPRAPRRRRAQIHAHPRGRLLGGDGRNRHRPHQGRARDADARRADCRAPPRRARARADGRRRRRLRQRRRG